MAETFSNILTRLRHEKQWKQVEVAALVGLSQSSITNFEKGSRFPSTKTLKKFSDVFGVNISELLGEKVTTTTAIKVIRDIYGLSPRGLKKVSEFVELVKCYEKSNVTPEQEPKQ